MNLGYYESHEIQKNEESENEILIRNKNMEDLI